MFKKSFWSMRRTLWVLLVLSAPLLLLASCKEQPSDSTPAEREPRHDITSRTQQLWDLEEGPYLRCMGLQFYQGEPAALWGSSHTGGNLVIDETGVHDGTDIYLYRADGSRELLFENLGYDSPDLYYNFDAVLGEDGSLYISTPEEIIRIDKNGNKKFCSSLLDSVNGNREDICLLPDGRIIVEALNSDTSETRLWEMDAETGVFAEKDLGVVIKSLSYIAPNGGNICLLDKDGFHTVDETDGNTSFLLSFTGTSYVLNLMGNSSKGSGSLKDFRINADGTFDILWQNQGDGFLETLSPVSGENRTILVLRAVSLGNSPLKQSIAEFNASSQEYYVMLEECPDNADPKDFITQTQVKLATGGDVDLILGNEMREVLWQLFEKGTFEDLTPYIEASGIRTEDYFPFVFDAWRQDGKIYGVCLNQAVSSYIIDASVFKGRELPEDVEAFADALLDYEEDAVLMNYSYFDSREILRWLLQGSDDFWGMLDWKHGKCDFDGELFRKLIAVAERYGWDERNTYPALMSKNSEWFPALYRSAKELQREGKTAISHFFDDGCHPLADDYRTLAVSASSPHKEGAWALVCFLLSRELQSESDRPLLKQEYLGMLEKEQKRLASEAGLAAKPEKQPQLTPDKMEELTQAIQNARVCPLRTEPLLSIVCDETETYFNGTKTLDEVIKVIENRVKLYLQENK